MRKFRSRVNGGAGGEGAAAPVCVAAWVGNGARAAALAVACVLAGPAGAATLAEVVGVAVGTHPTVKAAAASKRAADQDVDDARSGFFPSVELRAEAGPERVNSSTTRGRASRANAGGSKAAVQALHKSGELTVTQNLFEGFDTRYRTDAARERVAVSRHQLFDAQEVIGLRAVEAFLNVIRDRMVLRLGEENFETHRAIYRDVETRALAGAAEGAELHQAESRLRLAEARVVQFQGDLRRSEIDYREVVGGMPGDLEMPGAVATLPASADDAVRVAIVGNPVLQAAAAAAQAQRAEVKVSRSPFWPSVDLEVTQTREEDVGGVRGPAMSTEALVVMRYNLFAGGRDYARNRRAIELAGEANQSEAETRRLVEEQARIDFNAYEVSHDRVPILEQRVNASTAAVATYRDQFDIGRRTLLDVLDVENELFQAKVNLVDARIDDLFAQHRLMASLGRLLASLGVAMDASVEAAEEGSSTAQ